MSAVVEFDTIRTIYKELFTIQFLHDGYGPDRKKSIAESISLEPDKKTEVLFKNYNMDYRFSNDILICFTRSKILLPPASDPQAPYIKFSDGLQIRFLMNVTNDFINKTLFDAADSFQVYYFTNQIHTGPDNFISVNQKVSNSDLKDVSDVNPDQNCFGVIDIYKNNTIGSYNLFDAGIEQKLLNPVYKIQFKSKI